MKSKNTDLPEPWLRGILPDHDAVTGHLLRSSEQIFEDAANAIGDLTVEQLWAQPAPGVSAGFHIRHLAGSTLRLCAYLEGRQLTGEELEAMAREREPGADAAELIEGVRATLARFDSLIRALRPEDYASIRHVGRKMVPVTAIGLAIHTAEHGQRHAGQARTIAKIMAKAVHR